MNSNKAELAALVAARKEITARIAYLRRALQRPAPKKSLTPKKS